MDEEDQLTGFNFDGEDGEDDSVVKKKSKKKGGGFQCMGFGPTVLKGIKNRGYKLPTPIQRKVLFLTINNK